MTSVALLMLKSLCRSCWWSNLDFALRVGNYFYVMETGAIVIQGSSEQFSEQQARTYLAM
jgi:ABC-type branched-subunit amino acid transport system ATPase component